MKHVSLTLTAMLLLGAIPLTAAALDYGPNQSLLAASDAPQLPGAQARAVASGDMPSPGAIVSGTSESDAPATYNASKASEATPPGPSTSRGHGPSANNRSHQSSPAAKAGQAPSQPSWQSLLPGSIQ